MLSRICRRVYTIERPPRAPAWTAEAAVLGPAPAQHHQPNVGDGCRKAGSEQAPFDRIIVTAAAAQFPVVLADQLAEGGILVMPLGNHRRDQELVRLIRHEDRFEEQSLGLVRFVPLIEDTPDGAEEDYMKRILSPGPKGATLS